MIAILAALAAGACFAAAGVLQQRVAATRPQDESLSYRLLLDLARQPQWLAGISLAVVSYAFQALALAFGALAVVQPLIVTELLFAIPLSARLQHKRLGAREWCGAVAVAGGLGLAIASANPRGGSPLPPGYQWLIVLLSAGAVAATGALIGRRLTGTVRASLFAVAAATTLGTQGALLQATTQVFRAGILQGLTSWQPYLMAVFAIGGLLLVQSAYQAGPLAASLPVVDAVEPTVAVVIAVAIFGEHVRLTSLPLAGTAVGIVALLSGIVALDTSPLVRMIYASQRDMGPDQRHLAAEPAL